MSTFLVYSAAPLYNNTAVFQCDIRVPDDLRYDFLLFKHPQTVIFNPSMKKQSSYFRGNFMNTHSRLQMHG